METLMMFGYLIALSIFGLVLISIIHDKCESYLMDKKVKMYYASKISEQEQE